MKLYSAAMPSRRTFACGLFLAASAVACRDAVAPADDVVARAKQSRLSVATPAALEAFYGPERFTRGTGAPEDFVRQIATAHFEAPFVLHVRSGDATGANRVSSATVRLDGNTVLGPSAFSQQQGKWSMPVTLGATAVLSVALASAPGSYVEIWIEGQRSGTPFCSDGRSDASEALRQAIAATPAGGRVIVCAGTHHLTKVRITKAITIEGIGSPKPVLDFDGACCGLRIDGAVGGPVRIRGLQFQHGKYQEILVSGATDSVVIEGSDFYPGTDAGSSWGLYNGVAIGPAAAVLVQGNTFNGGDLGVSVHQGSTATILDNSFTGQGNAIHAGGGSTVRIEHNTFSGCGPFPCIATFDANAPGSTVDVLGNTIQVDFARATGSAVQLSVGTYRIEHNVISGTGGSRDPNSNQTWPMRNAGIAVQGNATLLGNRISDAATGLSFGEAGTVAVGYDNTISNVGAVMNVYRSTAVTLHRNDFTNYGTAIQYINTPGTVSLTCNWWGSASGPQPQPGGVTSGTYAPWATQPIAGTSLPCDPAAPVTAMRVCPTAASGGPMTVATFSQAHNLVAAGGLISFCAGTHVVTNAPVTKPLTVTSEAGTMATLDGRTWQVFSISNVAPAGAVKLSRLRFIGGTTFANVFVGTAAGDVSISSNEFHPAETGPYGTGGGLAGVFLGGADIGSVILDGNTFLGGDVGFHAYSVSGALTFRGNTFLNQNHAAIKIAMVSETGPKPGPILIEANTIRGCGRDWCLFTQHAVTAVGNTIEIPIDRPTYSPFRIDNFTGGTSVVTDNVLTGTGEGADRSLSTGYPIGGSALSVIGVGRLERNRITNAYTGIGAFYQASLTGSNNVITHSFSPFTGGGNPSGMSLSMTRNDVLDYLVPLANPWGAFIESGLTLKCNYWGSASGPAAVTQFASVYVPWAIQPIANSPTVTCP